MNLRRSIAHLALVASLVAPALSSSPVRASGPSTDSCPFPSDNRRFGITVGHAGGGLGSPAVAELSAGVYLDWGANMGDPNAEGMDYYPMIHVDTRDPDLQPYGYRPSGDELEQRILANPGATWLVGNEADYRWHGDHATPEDYAAIYHDVYAAIKRVDPGAKVATNALATVSPLRLAWLDRTWHAYQDLFGEDMPVDVWAIHAYVVNEMVHEWGPGLPTGIRNAVGYGAGQWDQVDVPGASGGTIHQSRDAGARAYFAFNGTDATLYLRTGPDAGIADIYRDKVYVESVDLYAPTPGMLTRTYAGLPPSPDPLLGDLHHLRVQVTGQKNFASSGTWIRVDAARAASTADFPTGRLEDDNPLRARISVTVDDYDNLDELVAQIRLIRQWMAEHGQQDKPLINTEFGILIGEDQGFDYRRVRDFMLGSFDLYLNGQEVVDPALGMPDDGNRLIQQWFWFILAIDRFNGATVHTGLLDPDTGDLLRLGQDFAAYVGQVAGDVVDLEATYLALTPRWPLFSGEEASVLVDGSVRNLGNLPAEGFWIRLAHQGSTVRQWHVDGLSAIHGGNDTFPIHHEWNLVADDQRTLVLTADSTGQLDDPCAANNSRTATLVFQDTTDMTLENLVMTPEFPTGTTTDLSFQVDLSNVASRGTSADRIVVKLWDGAPEAGGTLVQTETVLRGPGAGPRTLSFEWHGVQPGPHDVIIEVQRVAGESNISNNRIQHPVFIPRGDFFRFLPAVPAN